MARRSLLAAALPLAVASTAEAATPQGATDGPTPKVHRPLERLLDGNRRFVAGKSVHPHQRSARQQMLAAGQHPFVITVACADSRATPEIVFDQGLGDVFDNRVVGNIVDDVVLAGIEYALAHMGPPLLMVLGHERCGAVTAAINAVRTGAMPAGHMASIVDRLRPVAEAALHWAGDPVAYAVRANIRVQLDHVLRRSSLVAELAASGRVQLVGAFYDLDTGEVTLLDQGPGSRGPAAANDPAVHA